METGGFEDIWRWEHEQAATVVERAFRTIIEPLAARVSESLGDDLLREWTQLYRSVREPRAFWRPAWEVVLEDLDRRVRAHVLRTVGSPPPGQWPESEKELDVVRLLLAGDLLEGRMNPPVILIPTGEKPPHIPVLPASKSGEKLSKEARALAALADNPDWTDQQIAEAAGCKRQSLYRMKRFVAAKRLLKDGKKRFPIGSRDRESGDMEAWDDGDDD
jgi:hypothetical protein